MHSRICPKPVARLPIDALPAGDICPPLDPRHVTWDIVAPWDDPLASRGGYNVPSGKVRQTVDGQPAVVWQASDRSHLNQDRMFVTGEPTWREYTITCRVQPVQDSAPPTHDEPFGAQARAGLVFRIETVRRYYTFCIENRKRLVLYRRNDLDWQELAGCDVQLAGQVLTLRVTLDADAIRAECPELDAAFGVTDTAYTAGRAGFRALGACRLFGLELAATPGQEAVNARRTARLATRTARLSAALPDEIEAGTIDLSGQRELVACMDFCTAERNDLLFRTPEGLVAETWDGTRLWEHHETLDSIVFSTDVLDGRRILYALTGSRKPGTGSGLDVRGAPKTNVVQDQIVTVDGASGAVLARAPLPVSPREDLLRHYDLSYETGRISGRTATDILVREWRADWGGGGDMLWAFDGDLNPLWERSVHPGYGHRNAVHFRDVDDDGRDEILAGGNLLSAHGELQWRHDRADAFFETLGGQHYDAVLIGNYADDREIDPVAFLVGGSAGVYVVDALTGATRSHHLVGHAQWGLPCKVRDDLPGTEVMVGTRWGNYGILTLFSGRGDRLWSIQPDFMLQGTCPVQWTREGAQHIWCCRSHMAMGLYDGFGRMVKPLEKVRNLYKGGTKKPTVVLRRAHQGPDLLGLRIGETLHLFGAEY